MTWEETLAEQLVPNESERSPVTVEQLRVFLARMGAFDQVGNVSTVKEGQKFVIKTDD